MIKIEEDNYTYIMDNNDLNNYKIKIWKTDEQKNPEKCLIISKEEDYSFEILDLDRENYDNSNLTFVLDNDSIFYQPFLTFLKSAERLVLKDELDPNINKELIIYKDNEMILFKLNSKDLEDTNPLNKITIKDISIVGCQDKKKFDIKVRLLFLFEDFINTFKNQKENKNKFHI